jgi:hypothetical protein
LNIGIESLRSNGAHHLKFGGKAAFDLATR